MGDASTQHQIDAFIAQWRDTGGSELANTQSFINGLCALIGVPAPDGSRTDDAHNDYVFERRVFQDNGDGTQSFGRIDCYKRDCFILEAKQGSEGDRAAAARGEDDLDLFGQSASARVKRGTARRGTPGWTRAMLQAKGQAERYAKALPTDHGWPPILLIADIGYCIDVYADFTGTGKAYAQFPDRASYRIMLDDLRDDKVRERLALIWTNPKALDPSTRAAKATREIADYLATISKRLEARGHNAEAVSGFLMRLLFTMFAEDTGVLLPRKSFTELLKGQLDHPEHLHHQLTALWTAMDKGEFAPSLGIPVKHFNGYLFKSREALPLEREELLVLIEAAGKDWTEVEPAIFGTLLERALNPKERAKLGAHYTPRAYVERLIAPTIMEPLRSDWDGVRGAVESLMGEDKVDAARAVVEGFHAQLAQTKVLDPACGTGNFLYVAMARMKELEGEVLELLAELGDNQYLAELSGHTITPENFLGIEINPRAAAIAQLVLWIGYLQWHFRVNGKDRSPPEPILKDIRTIENRDALIEYDRRELVKDENGRPVTRWDGETMKLHPVTGRKVPDEDARVEVYRYVNPRAAKWPKADFIVGNPPFIGNKRMRDRLGREYVDALFGCYDSPQSIDLVMFWWDIAGTLVRQGQAKRLGFITTNSLTQTFNRKILSRHLARNGEMHLVFGIGDHPWIDEAGSAAVRVAMSVAAHGPGTGQSIEVLQESGVPGEEVLARRVGLLGANLEIGANLLQASRLKANSGLASLGSTLIGQGFLLEQSDAYALTDAEPISSELVRPYLSGRDITTRDRRQLVIDAFGITEEALRSRYPHTYQYLKNAVFPDRQTNARKSYRTNWWIHGEPRSELRLALSGLSRYLVTARTAKHRMMTFMPSSTLAESRVVAIALDDDLHLGILSSRVHSAWCVAWGAKQGIGNDLNYNVGECFDPFPFPADVPEQLKDRIRTEAEALDALRKRVLAAHEDLTLTKLYNVLEALRANDGRGRALTDQERDTHDRGLVTLIRQHHDAIDALVAEAYGWPVDLSDEDILTRLVALNKERAAEEARGLIRYLRPELQDPGYAAPVNQTLDFGEAAVVLPDNIIAWPKTLPEQVSAVQSILTAAPAPLAAQDIARSFKGKRAATVRPVLESLAMLGMARRLKDGRYAA
ncbi:type II restriction/modification system DNA methylase subunit YeeA [Blastomonas natatoria]|uniref:site-specific DNA-methyltransferase (adenine-specific) n=1 Tax=Blastomonas natatoria TaxID=34015 RepID=A0A2V3V9U3_9SPHN|nr:DNA methyltransferase [Blastomonas natatoria]PXW77508.1 type II restriction/modification system DNA methylase subunit YeeA [Blastomonas natatoria]